VKTLVLIDSDPRTSPRAAEAIRIAAGVGAWKKTEVHVALRGPAVHCLSPWVDEFVDSENFEHYLPIVGEWDHPVLVEEGAEDWAGIAAETEYRTRVVSSAELAAFLAGCDHLIRFQ
jgi:hypothetical protein